MFKKGVETFEKNTDWIALVLYGLLTFILFQFFEWTGWFWPVIFIFLIFLIRWVFIWDWFGQIPKKDIVMHGATVRLIALLSLLVLQEYTGVIDFFGSSNMSAGPLSFFPKAPLYSLASLWWAWNNERAVRAFVYSKRGKKDICVFLYSILVTALEALLFTYGFHNSHVWYGVLACTFPVAYGCYIYLPRQKSIRLFSRCYVVLGFFISDFLVDRHMVFGAGFHQIKEQITLLFADTERLLAIVCYISLFICVLAMSRKSGECKRRHEILFGFAKAALVFRMGFALLYLFGFWHPVRIPFLDEYYMEEFSLLAVLLIGDYQRKKMKEAMSILLASPSSVLMIDLKEIRIAEETSKMEYHDQLLNDLSYFPDTWIFNGERWETIYEIGQIDHNGRHFGIFKYQELKNREMFVLEKTEKEPEVFEGKLSGPWEGRLSWIECREVVFEYLEGHCPAFAEKFFYLNYIRKKMGITGTRLGPKNKVPI